MQSEELVWSGSPSQVLNVPVYAVCLLLFWLVVPVFYAAWNWLVLRNIRYELTSERLRIRQGVLNKELDELELYRVRDYSIVEPFWLRLVGCGNIVLATADTTNPNFILRAVPHAATLKDQIRTNTERMRQRRGVRSLEVDSPDQPL